MLQRPLLWLNRKLEWLLVVIVRATSHGASASSLTLTVSIKINEGMLDDVTSSDLVS